MERNPHLRDAMRQHILGEDLLRLPAIVAELSQVLKDFVASSNERMERVENDVADLKTGRARLEARQSRMENDITDIKAGQARLE